LASARSWVLESDDRQCEDVHVVEDLHAVNLAEADVTDVYDRASASPSSTFDNVAVALGSRTPV
jgi:hypothetical protein